MDALCELETDRDCFGTCPRILGSTSKAFDFSLCNPRVSGRRRSGPGKPSGMPRECTRIMPLKEACSRGGGGVPDILILQANSFDDQLASEEVVRTFFLRLGVLTGLPGVTVETISSGRIGTRQWTGEQGAAVVVAEEECPGGTLE